MNRNPHQGDRIVVTILGKLETVICERWFASSDKAGSFAQRKGLRYSGYGGGYVVYQRASDWTPPEPKVPLGNTPAMAEAMR